MDASARGDLALTGAVTLLLLAAALLVDPEVRASLAVTPALRAVLCTDALAVETLTNDGNLTVPEGGVAVRVHEEGVPVPATLELHRRDPGSDWRLAWTLEAPSGREVFYVATVKPGTEAYVLARPAAPDHCPARSAVLRAPG